MSEIEDMIESTGNLPLKQSRGKRTRVGSDDD